MDAFRKADEMGADLVEVDVRLTVDNRPVVAHDASLKRVYGIAQNIEELALQALRAATSTGVADPVPTFAEVASLCAALKLGLYLDIKEVNREAVTAILQTLQANHLRDYVIFGSFRPDWLAEIKTISPSVRTSILFSSLHLDPVRLAQSIQADYVHPCWENAAPEPHKLLTPEWLHSVRQAGLGIVTWHEERPAEIEALVRLGVDGICSDMPDLLTQLTPAKSHHQP